MRCDVDRHARMRLYAVLSALFDAGGPLVQSLRFVHGRLDACNDSSLQAFIENRIIQAQNGESLGTGVTRSGAELTPEERMVFGVLLDVGCDRALRVCLEVLDRAFAEKTTANRFRSLFEC